LNEQRDDLPELSAEESAQLLAYRQGVLSLEQQRAFEEEILKRPDLAQALYDEVNLDQALRVRSQPGRTFHLPRRFLLPLALAALVVLALLPKFTVKSPLEPTPAFRGEETRLSALSPRGVISGTSFEFRWTHLANAQRYRLEIFDAGSTRP
jgi:hypothetical protein